MAIQSESRVASAALNQLTGISKLSQGFDVSNSNENTPEAQLDENRFRFCCEECSKPLSLYGFNTLQTTQFGKNKIVTRFFCDFCLDEFRETNRQTAKRFIEQSKHKLNSFKSMAEVSK